MEQLPDSLAATRFVQWVNCLSGRKPGFEAGRYLLQSGHRRLAFFSPYTDIWARHRLAGMADLCTQSGASGEVVPYLSENAPREREFERLTKERYRGFRQSAESPPGIPREYRAGRLMLTRTAWDVYENAVLFSVLRPFFKQALARKDITAWVGCNDTVAIMAWSFLTSRGVRIPEDIAVQGFDNTFESLERNVSSYDFNFPALANVVQNFLLRPSITRGIRKLLRPQIDGCIIERASTGKKRSGDAWRM